MVTELPKCYISITNRYAGETSSRLLRTQMLRSSDNPKAVKPFLRWAGGKRWIASQLADLIQPECETYYEPFLGGGSVYFAALPKSAVLTDVNARLIETYQMLRDSAPAVMAALEPWSNDERSYYKVREMEFEDSVHRAAQFIYLNRTCWNGLYRVNKQGKFNVPFANHNRPVFERRQLLAVSNALKGADIRCGDFDQILVEAGAGAFVYLDPPYVSPSENKGFSKYNANAFTWDDQLRLGRTASALANRGCQVLVSNIGQDEIVELYPGFSHKVIFRHSIVAASSQYRGITSELLLASEPELFQLLDE